MVNDGGIVTTLNPETGERIAQGRLTGALGAYYASPVAADGHVFFTSQRGAVAVLAPGGELTPMVVNDLVEDTYATPAFADGRIYIRTVEALYAFGKVSDSSRSTVPRNLVPLTTAASPAALGVVTTPASAFCPTGDRVNVAVATAADNAAVEAIRVARGR
jgi:hypothetical protein